MSKLSIGAKITLNHFKFVGFKSTKKQASSVDKRLSSAFIKNPRSTATYRRWYAKLLFSSQIYDYCIIFSEDGSDLYHSLKSNILNVFEQVTNRFEISSLAVLLIGFSPMFRKDTHSGTFDKFPRQLLNNVQKLSMATKVLISFVTSI